jgi:hypothetical protein
LVSKQIIGSISALPFTEGPENAALPHDFASLMGSASFHDHFYFDN